PLSLHDALPISVGRPPRLDVAPRSGGKAARFATGDIDDPDVRKIFVALLGQGRHDEGDAPAVRRQLWIGHEPETGQVVGDHAPAAGAHDRTEAKRSTSCDSTSRAPASAPRPSTSPITAAMARTIRRPSVGRQPNASSVFSHWIERSTMWGAKRC